MKTANLQTKLLIFIVIAIAFVFYGCAKYIPNDSDITDDSPEIAESSGNKLSGNESSGSLANDEEDSQDASGDVNSVSNELMTTKYVSESVKTDDTGSIICKTKYTYDSQGRILSVEYSRSENIINKSVYEYPDDDTVIDKWYESGKLYTYNINKYVNGEHVLNMGYSMITGEEEFIGGWEKIISDDGTVSEMRTYLNDMQIGNKTLYTYDNGTLIKEETRNSNDETVSVTEYDIENNITTIKTIDLDTKEEEIRIIEDISDYLNSNNKVINTYIVVGENKVLTDSVAKNYNGDTIITASYDENGNEQYRVESEFNEEGKEEACRVYINGELSQYSETENGENGSYTVKTYIDGNVTGTFECVKNLEGRIVSMKSWDSDGKVIHGTEFEYASDGILVKKTETSFESVEITEYKYTDIIGAERTLGELIESLE